jgi:hypothetical protein
LSTVWFNGQFVDEALPLDPHDRGFLLGDGVFETVAVINHKPLWLDEHLQRMSHAAAELGISFNAEGLFAGLGAVHKKCQAQFEVLRITLSRGKTVRGLAGDGASPSLLITLDGFDAKNLFEPCRLKVSQARRNEFAPSSRLKTLSYIDGIAAAREVADATMLMLNTRVTSRRPRLPMFFCCRKRVGYAALNQGILPAHAARVADSAKSMDLRPLRRPFHGRFIRADAVFCAIACGFSGLLQLNGEPLGNAQ